MRYFELCEAGSPLRFYHGTSSQVLPMILQQGLTPQSEPASAMRGNGSTIPAYTERMVFLTPLAKEAMFYARELCRKIGGEPVLLAVQLQANDPLHVSDDYICNAVVNAILAQQGHPPLTSDDYDADGDLDLSVSETAGTVEQWQEFIVQHRDAFYAGKLDQIVDHDDLLDGMPQEAIRAALEAGYTAFQRAVKAPWQASARRDQRDPAVAFAGTIAPERIRVMNPAQRKRAADALRHHRRSVFREEASIPRDVPDVLYHGTSRSAWHAIQEENALRASDHGDGSISFTSDSTTAERFATWAARRDGDAHGVVLLLNGPKLAAEHPLEPFADSGLLHGSEREWRTPENPRGSIIANLSRYLLDVEGE